MRRSGIGMMMAVALLGTTLSATAAEGGQAGRSYMTTTATGYTPDHRGAQAVYSGSPVAVTREIVDKLVSDTRSEFAKLHPEHLDAYVVSVSMNSDHSVLVTALPYADGSHVTAGGEPPGMPNPPSGYPATSNETTRVDIHQNQNGYNRDTRFERNPGQGGGAPGQWWVSRDLTEYVGGGGVGCGGSGQRPCPDPN